MIALAEQLSDEERGLVVDAIAPKESNEELVRAWREEIEHRAARVRSGSSAGEPAEDVFARIEAKIASH